MPGVAGAAAIAGVASIASGALASSGSRKAAQAQGIQQAAALAQQQRQFELTQQNLQPFIQAGQTGLQGLEQGSTAQGLDQRLADIFSGSSFQNLLGERTRAAQGGLAAAGLTRSGAGLQAIAGVPQELGLQLEQLLGGRQGQLATLGQQTAAQLGGLSGQFSGQQSQLFQNLGQTQAQGILGQGQADASRNQAFIQGLGQLGAAGIGAFGGGLQQDIGTPQQRTDISNQVAGGFLPATTPGFQTQAPTSGQFQGPLFPVG